MVLLCAEKKADYLHELFALQHFIANCDGPANITTEVVEDRVSIDFEDGIDPKENAFVELFDYNGSLAKKIPLKLSSLEEVELFRLCRNRISKKIIETEIINKKSRFFSKVDKYIFYPGNNYDARYTSNVRHIVTLSSNYCWTGEVITVTTAATVNTIHDYALPSLQQLLASMSI